MRFGQGDLQELVFKVQAEVQKINLFSNRARARLMKTMKNNSQ